MEDEFNRNRFRDSSFKCTVNSDCNFGTCETGKCHCNNGYRDSTTAACDHEMPEFSKTTAWALEAALGWFFPAGWAHENLLPTMAVRLGIELAAVGMWLGYFYERDRPIGELRKENFDALGYFVGANIFSAAHIIGWLYSSYFLAQYDVKNSVNAKAWHKDKGHADLTILADKVLDSVRITQNLFETSDCALVEECIDGPGERRLLRFDGYIFNNGTGDFVMGLENVKPVWSDCHQHYHGPDTANYFVEHTLNYPNGTVHKTIKRGHKQGYCYIDSVNIKSNYPGKFGCGIPPFTRQLTQGITAGWADIYDSETDCQWIDITGLSAGNYSLSVVVNPRGTYYQDADLTNNEAIVNVEIPEVDLKKERMRWGRKLRGEILKGPRS